MNPFKPVSLKFLGLHLVSLLSAVYIVTPTPRSRDRNHGFLYSRCDSILITVMKALR